MKNTKTLVCRVCGVEHVEVAKESLSVVCYKCTSKLVNGEIYYDGKNER